MSKLPGTRDQLPGRRMIPLLRAALIACWPDLWDLL
jgi:hypothetical protein